jgi:uncharacterized cupredoxin-like copper-binding protein
MKKITRQLFYTLLLSTLLCGSFFNVNAQSNNTIANATKITSLPFTDSNVNIPNSNPNNANGLTGCSLTNRSVVYKFTPVSSGTVIVEVKNPSGTSGAITTIASNENATQTSDLSPTPDGNICHSANPKTVNVNAGQTYYFLIVNGSSTTIEFTGTASLGIVSPTLTTSDASSITVNSAVLGGDISTDNGNAITERGVVYSTSDTEPEIGDSGVTKEIEGGTTTGAFSETISGLTKGTTYYFRAYAINSEGTGYGDVKSFTTTRELPNVTTTDATNVTATNATLGGEITTNGSSAITEKGIVYSTTNPSPRITDASGTTKVVDADAGTTISEALTGLTTTNVYYYRAYATNSQGTGYGTVKRFTLNNGLHFLNSGSTRVTITDNAAFDFSSGFTAEAWIKADVLSTRNVFSQYSSSDRAFSLFLLSSGKFEYTANPSASGSSEQYFTTTNTAIATGTWYHVAITYDGTIMRAFVNGVAAGTESHTGTLFNSSQPIEIGARNNAHFFDGTIDEVRFWNRALSVTEINDGMNAQVPNNANGLVAYYKMNQGTAEGDNTSITTLTDSGPNSLHGTLNNFTRTGTTSNFVAGANGVSGQTNFGHNRFTSTGNWSTTGNWSHGSAPSTTQNATIANGITVTIDVDDLNLNDFTLESGATISVPKDKEITINGAFNTSGNLDLSSDGSDSGVLFLKGTSTGNITYKRGGILANKWSIVTPPVSGQKIKAFADAAGNDIRTNTGVSPNRYAIAYYDDSQSAGNKWVYYTTDMDANIEFEAGKSYAISRASDGEVTFTGTLTSESLFQTLTTDQWAAIGNPFTTYFPINKNSNSSFLNDNSSALDDTYQSIYMWDNSQNKYIAVTELDASARSLTPGQGFFIKMKNGQTDIVFKEEKRSTKPASGNNSFAKTKSDNEITIDVFVNDGLHKIKTSVKYFDHTTIGFDKGYDIGNFNSENLDLYSKLIDNSSDTNFTIQSLPNNSIESMVIPIGIKTSENSEIKLSVSSKNLPNNYKIFLEDKELNSFHQLDESDSSYIISLAKNSTFNNRFKIHVTPQVLSIDDVNLSSLNVYVSAKRTLTIKGLQSEKATIKVVSILGKELINTQLIRNQIELPGSLKSGIYIINIESNKGNITKKIILE